MSKRTSLVSPPPFGNSLAAVDVAAMAGYMVEEQATALIDYDDWRTWRLAPELIGSNSNSLYARPPRNLNLTDAHAAVQTMGSMFVDSESLYDIIASQLDVVEHVVSDAGVSSHVLEVADTVLEEGADRARAHAANIDRFREQFRVRFTRGSESQPAPSEVVINRLVDDKPSFQVLRHTETAPGEAVVNTASREDYWGKIRSSLQRWLGLSLEDLAKLLDLSKATIVYINAPDRKVRPMTANKVLNLYGTVVPMVEAKGEEYTRAWFAATGRAALDRGTVQLEREIRSILARGRINAEAIAISLEPDTDVDEEAPEPGPVRAQGIPIH